MIVNTRGSNCYLEYISNSNVTDNSTFWRCNFVHYIPPNIQNFLEPLLVRFGSFRTIPILFDLEQNKPNKLEPALFGKPSLIRDLVHPEFMQKFPGILIKLIIRVEFTTCIILNYKLWLYNTMKWIYKTEICSEDLGKRYEMKIRNESMK